MRSPVTRSSGRDHDDDAAVLTTSAVEEVTCQPNSRSARPSRSSVERDESASVRRSSASRPRRSATASSWSAIVVEVARVRLLRRLGEPATDGLQRVAAGGVEVGQEARGRAHDGAPFPWVDVVDGPDLPAVPNAADVLSLPDPSPDPSVDPLDPPSDPLDPLPRPWPRARRGSGPRSRPRSDSSDSDASTIRRASSTDRLAGLGAQVGHGARPRGLELLPPLGDDAVRLLARPPVHVLPDALRVGAGVVPDARGLAVDARQPLAVAGELRLGVGLHGLGLGDAGLDLLLGVVVRRDEVRPRVPVDARRRAA